MPMPDYFQNTSIQLLQLKCQETSSYKVFISDIVAKANTLDFGNEVSDLLVALKTLDVVNSKEKDLDFSSQLLVLDFFTYCCINCMHILPDLEVIERTFGDKVKVIGIHSAKFENEKSTENILKAVERYNIAHPVLNDKDCLIWNKLHIKCWPTIVVFGRGLKPLICCSGEGYRDIIIQTIEAALEIFGSISVNPTTIVLPRRNPNQLYYPGKIALSNDELLVVSDTGNNRIVICDFEGNVKNIVGCGFRGYLDGPKDIARFNGPQGVCVLLDGSILVADTGNHRIRMIDVSGNVSTLIGNGKQGGDFSGGKEGPSQAISSPWDLTTYKSSLDAPEILLIANAGSHQIWGYFFKDTVWWKDKLFTERSCVALVGSGNEENRNNTYPHKVGLAQPSGVAVDVENDALYVADSESSTIRRISMKDGSCKCVCGGERDPSNLFAFGDVDGLSLSEARLQHPLAVVVKSDGILVADSYNHKIKLIQNPLHKSSTCSSIIGTGRNGSKCGSFSDTQLNEPGGMCYNRTKSILYIADTNAHRILEVDFKTQVTRQVHLKFPDKESPDKRTIVNLRGHYPKVILTVDLIPDANVKINEDLKQEWKVTPVNGGGLKFKVEKAHSNCYVIQIDLAGDDFIEFDVATFIIGCKGDVCIMKDVCFKFKAVFTDGIEEETFNLKKNVIIN